MLFFLTVYLKNWEYSQSLLSEETLPNSSCESPLPPSFSSSLLFSSSFLHFPVLVFGSSLRGLWYKARGCPPAVAPQTNSIWGTVPWWKVIPRILVIPPIYVSASLIVMDFSPEVRDNRNGNSKKHYGYYSLVPQLHRVPGGYRKYSFKMWFSLSQVIFKEIYISCRTSCISSDMSVFFYCIFT